MNEYRAMKARLAPAQDSSLKVRCPPTHLKPAFRKSIAHERELDFATGGMTYCAIASFALCGRLAHLPRRAELVRWLVARQVAPTPDQLGGDDTASSSSSSSSSSDASHDCEAEEEERSRGDQSSDVAGFQGRIGKAPDACYSFWTAASLAILRSSASTCARTQRRTATATATTTTNVGDDERRRGEFVQPASKKPRTKRARLTLPSSTLAQQQLTRSKRPTLRRSHRNLSNERPRQRLSAPRARR